MAALENRAGPPVVNGGVHFSMIERNEMENDDVIDEEYLQKEVSD